MQRFEKDFLKAAIIQHAPVYLNIGKSMDLALKYIQDAANNNSNLIVFPETWLPGYPVWLDFAPEAGMWEHPGATALYRILSENALVIDGPHFRKLQQIARKYSVLIVMGAHERKGKSLYNTLFYFNADGSYQLHRKLMPTYTERLIWAQGDGSTMQAVETEYGAIGGLICWEHWMPLARAAMHAQKETVHIAQWPYVKDLHQNASRNYAFEGQCFVIAAGGILTKKQMMEGLKSHADHSDFDEAVKLLDSTDELEEAWLLKGGSAVIKPSHNYLMEAVYQDEGIFYAELDLDLITEGSLLLDVDGHYSRPDVFTLNVNTKPQNNVAFED